MPRGELRAAALPLALLEAADLRGARLQNADLTGACLADADLTEAEFNAQTLWPTGFAPADHGAVQLP